MNHHFVLFLQCVFLPVVKCVCECVRLFPFYGSRLEEFGSKGPILGCGSFCPIQPVAQFSGFWPPEQCSRGDLFLLLSRAAAGICFLLSLFQQVSAGSAESWPEQCSWVHVTEQCSRSVPEQCSMELGGVLAERCSRPLCTEHCSRCVQGTFAGSWGMTGRARR